MSNWIGWRRILSGSDRFRCAVHSFINCTGNRNWFGLVYKTMKHNLGEIQDKRFSAYINIYTNGYIWTKYYNTLQFKPKKKTKRKKQTNCEVRIKQTSSTETDHSLVMSNINKTVLSSSRRIFEILLYSLWKNWVGVA